MIIQDVAIYLFYLIPLILMILLLITNKIYSEENKV